MLQYYITSLYLNESIIYIFKKILSSGLCPEDLKKNSDFDTEFYAYGLLNDRLYFRGIRASHIFLDPFDGRWTLQSLKNPGKISDRCPLFEPALAMSRFLKIFGEKIKDRSPENAIIILG